MTAAQRLWLYALMALTALLVLAIGGCATPPEPKVRTVEVLVPIRAACVPPEVPPPPASYADDVLPTDPAAAAERYRLTAAASQQRKARLAILEPVIAGCR